MSERSDYRATVQVLLEDMTPELAEEFFDMLEEKGKEFYFRLNDGFDYAATIVGVDYVRKARDV
jgi:hypothetical protein